MPCERVNAQGSADADAPCSATTHELQQSASLCHHHRSSSLWQRLAAAVERWRDSGMRLCCPLTHERVPEAGVALDVPHEAQRIVAMQAAWSLWHELDATRLAGRGRGGSKHDRRGRERGRRGGLCGRRRRDGAIAVINRHDGSGWDGGRLHSSLTEPGKAAMMSDAREQKAETGDP
jgi:hypothetical protein